MTKRTNDKEKLDSLLERISKLKKEISKVIVGQDRVIEELLICLFSRGHALIMGVPGLAKTLIASTMGDALDLEFKRIQFTPDLMPSDITGTEVLEEDPKTKERSFRFVRGPIFTNILLADEINRTPPKTQSALLQAMQEHQVSCNGVTYNIDLPFFVIATQNPIEQEGTYPLAEAQLDRFFFQINIEYPSENEELNIIKNTTTAKIAKALKVFSSEEVHSMQEVVREVPVAEHVENLAVRIARSTRPKEASASELVREFVSWGAGPRATQALILASKARAVLSGRNAPSGEDMIACVHPILRHRLILNFHAHAQGITAEKVIEEILKNS
ncbi:AAA family ATPase [Elusimicrobiota bacterium]